MLGILGAVTLACAMAAPLGTAALPAAGRLLFWGALIGGNVWKWQLWFRHIPPLLPPGRAALPLLFVGGGALLGALMPLEFGLLASVSGLAVALPAALLPVLVAAIAFAAGAVTSIIVTLRWLAARDQAV
jgi:hypothetical protein